MVVIAAAALLALLAMAPFQGLSLPPGAGTPPAFGNQTKPSCPDVHAGFDQAGGGGYKTVVNTTLAGCCAACQAEATPVPVGPSPSPPTGKLCDAWVYAAADAPGQHGVPDCWLISGCTGYAPSAHRTVGLVSPTPTPTPTPPPPAPPARHDVTLRAEIVSASSFRLSVRFGGGGHAALPSPMIAATRGGPGGEKAAWVRRVSWGGLDGVASPAGALLVGAAGRWELRDASNRTVASSKAAPILDFGARGDRSPVVSMAVHGSRGAARDAEYWPLDRHGSPCLGNGLFAPPFYWENQTGLFALVVAAQGVASEASGDRLECYPATLSTPPPPPPSSCAAPLVGKDVVGGQLVGELSGVTQAQCCLACDAAPNQRCEYWVFACPESGAAPGGNATDDCWLLNGVASLAASPHRTVGRRPPPTPPTPGTQDTVWTALGEGADVYLAVAPGGLQGTRALYELSGPPALLPRYALGFMASWWGYRTYADVLSNMTAFRAGNYPVDSFIMDYDWFQCGTSECYQAVCYRPGKEQ